MKEYHLERLNDQGRALGIIIAMPFLFGVLATVWLWNHDSHSLYGKLGLALAVLSLLGIIICYFNMYKSYILRMDNDMLVIRNKKSTKEKKYNISDIALIQYNTSTHPIDAFISKKNRHESILIFSNIGKGIFVCTNTNNAEFNEFFNDIRNRINAKEKFIYAKQIKMTQVYRYLYINPLHENTKVIKKKTRESGFYFGIKIILLTVIPFMIIINLIPINLNPSAVKTFRYEGISFKREYYWKFETEEITKGKTYYIGGNNYSMNKNEEYNNFIDITISKEIQGESPQEYIANYFKDIESTKYESEIEEIKIGKFGDYDCFLAHYSYRMEGIKYYAVIYAFNTNDKSISIVKSGRSAGLRHDFTLIEKTFKVK